MNPAEHRHSPDRPDPSSRDGSGLLLPEAHSSSQGPGTSRGRGEGARHEQPGPMVRTAREGRTPGMDDSRHHNPHPSHVVMVTGSRSFIDSNAALRGLNAIWAMWGEITSPLLISGTARGADRLAESLFARAQLPIHRFPADWNTHGSAAGFRRNVAMIDALEDHRRRGAEVIVLALAMPCTPCPHRNPSPHITHGTEHARSQASRRGLPIITMQPWMDTPHFQPGAF